MTSQMLKMAPRDDLDERCRNIRNRILDSIDATLDELAQSESQRAAIAETVWAHIAPLLCRQATCRRAKLCRRNPCSVPR